MLQLQGMVSRRVFAWIPREGRPVAITHAIEQAPWSAWPRQWHREIYSTWRQLEALIAGLVRGRRIAMEYSPGDAVPYLDRIPAGVLDLVRAAGAEVVSSAPLVTRFYASWTDDHLASHRRSAEEIARIAREALAFAGERASAGSPVAEHELQIRIMEAFGRAGLVTNHAPLVAAGANAANPHYEPSEERARPIRKGERLLIVLWPRGPDNVFADLTWMGSLGERQSRAIEVWESVRDARDAAIAVLRDRLRRGEEVRGGEV